MAETSMPWDGTAYPANTHDDWIYALSEDGVIEFVGNQLAVTGASSPVAVNTGWAIVNGKLYRNSASINVTVATPATSTRIDRIILRADYSAKTITCVRLAGVEGGSAPALTQTDGTTWEYSLAQASITTGGVITLTDERDIHYRNGFHSVTFFVPAVFAYNLTDGAAITTRQINGWSLPDSKQSYCDGGFYMPDDYAAGTVISVAALVVPAASGNVYGNNTANIAAVGETVATHTLGGGSGTTAATANLVTSVSSLNLTASINLLDWVNLRFLRDAVSASDTCTGVLLCMGWNVGYTSRR
jgi:hypothetical protein